MALEVRLTPGACRDIASIYDWTAGKFGLGQADRYALDLNEAIQFLS
jgi:plasmid stabilization system protein ParE